MKKIISLVLCLGMLMGILGIVSFADETELVEKGSEWNYTFYELVDGEEPTPAPEGWTTGTGADSWEVGNAPFAGANYTSPDAQTVLTASFDAYLVQTFTVANAATVKVLTLSVIYDEDPVVYINGTQVWSAGGYKDRAYTTVDLSEYANLLKDGENVIAVYFRNALGGGGALMDLGLTAATEATIINADGSIVPAGATAEGFSSFGALNDPANVLDGINGNCCGSNWNPDVTQAITVNFLAKVNLTSVKVSTKDEGAFVEGYTGDVWGTYDVYALNEGVETKIGTINATPEGLVVDVADGIEADGVKVVITSWNRTTWAAVADIWAYGTELGATSPDPTPDTPVDPEPTPDTPVDPEPTPEGPVVSVIESFGSDGNEKTCPFGDIGGVANLFDGNATTVWGWGFEENMGVIINLESAIDLKGIFLQTKNEGAMTNNTDAHGTYKVEAYVDGAWVVVAESVDALIEGTTAPADVTTDKIKITVTSWANDNWGSIAEVELLTEAPKTGDASVYAIVFAVVALLGMGIVVTKKVHA